MLNNIPEELKVLPNWVLWRLENRNNSETKVPYCPHTGKRADNSKPATWGTFEQVTKMLPDSGMSGVGFVISPDCGYTCIDIDNPFKLKTDGSPKFDNPDELLKRQMGIVDAFDSYSEVSPSGKGLHVWIKGSVPSGRDKYSVGLYPAQRYMTMTGQVYKDRPIKQKDELLTQLWYELSPTSSTEIDTTTNEEQTQGDNQLLQMAMDAINGGKFKDLWEGEWQRHYPSQSEADFALVDMLAFYSQNRVQILRMFRNSGLGQRPKALRADYCERMMNRCFDNRPEPVNLEAMQAQLRKVFQKTQAKTVTKQVETVKEIRKLTQTIYTPPPGLIGELATFIYSASPRPVPEISLAAAIGLLAGVCGKSYNISGTGLNQYVLLLAQTGVGKEAIASGMGKIMASVEPTVPSCKEFIGPGEISSAQALIKYMDKKSSCFVSVIGEFGIMLQQLTGLRAQPSQVGLRRALLDLYNKSGKTDSSKPIIYSDMDKNTNVIKSPALTLIGESTPEVFYETLTEEMIREGFLPRFMTIEYLGKRPSLNENHQQAVIPPRLVEQFGMLCAYALQLNNGNQVIDVEQKPDAYRCLKNFDTKCDDLINATDNEVSRHLWNRGHIKALKLAGLLAVSTNYLKPVVTMDQALWAIRLVEADIKNLLNKFDAGDVGTPQNQNKQVKDLKKAFKWYLEKPWNDLKGYPGSTQASYNAKVIPHSFLTAFCRSRASFKQDRIGPVQALKTLLFSLLESGDIQEMALSDKIKSGIGKNGKIYVILDPKSFFKGK